MALITSDCGAMRHPEHQMVLITSGLCATDHSRPVSVKLSPNPPGRYKPRPAVPGSAAAAGDRGDELRRPSPLAGDGRRARSGGRSQGVGVRSPTGRCSQLHSLLRSPLQL